MKKDPSVDKYIMSAPEEVREKLEEIRSLIRQAAPEATEGISYSMPYYGYLGRLAYFANAKHHIGLYIPPPIIQNHKEELKKYTTSKSAVQFPLNEDLPRDLIIKLVKARVAWNENSKNNKT